MIDALYSLLALAILGAGIYAALAGSVALCLGISGSVELPITRPLCIAVILAGLALYIAGNMMLAPAIGLAR